MINFSPKEFILYAKKHNFINVIIGEKVIHLNDLNLDSSILHHYFINQLVIFYPENSNDYISVLYNLDKNINKINYEFSERNVLENYNYYYSSYYHSYYKDSNSIIRRKDLIDNYYSTLFEEDSFYTTEELLKIKNNLIFL